MFHAKCDKKFKTLTIVKSTNGNIFGGYTSADWTPDYCYSMNDEWQFTKRLLYECSES